MNCGNLGVCDSNELLGGWWTDAKKATVSAVKSATSAVISTAKDSQVPLISQTAALVRSAGNVASAPKTEAAAATPQVVYVNGVAQPAAGSSNTTLFVIAGVAVVALLAMKK